MARRRVDKLVVERGLVPTREKAKRLILAGEVLVDDAPVDKPGTLVREDATLRLRTAPKPFVGRGGEKLAGALDVLHLPVSDSNVLDVGASTGGFTDCLLKRGASRVTALDVGRGQLDWKLYSDPRVTVLEDVNARYLRPSDFPELFALVTVDVSFISLTKVLEAIASVVNPGGHLLMLVKPQFELGPDAVGRGGLVLDPNRHLEAIDRVAASAEERDLSLIDVVASPIKGASGNQEFFLLTRRNGGAGLSGPAFRRRARAACGLENP